MELEELQVLLSLQVAAVAGRQRPKHGPPAAYHSILLAEPESRSSRRVILAPF